MIIGNNKATILIVDDNRQNIKLLKMYLKNTPYDIILSDDGEEALKYITENEGTIDLILLDVMMPKLDGYEVCKRIKNDRNNRFIPVVMISAMHTLEDKIKGIEAGADDFLIKPINKYELLARIKALVRLKHLNDNLENTENVLFTLAYTIEAKDIFAKDHLTRISKYASKLGEYVGLSHEMIIALKYAGIMHDIGKIGISENILCKPTPLTEEEFEKIKEHPLIGETIIKPLRFSSLVAPIVRGHHERWDGKGYPDGLAGEEIPIGARIVAITDAYDAMITTRPYRHRMTQQKVISLLKKGAGIQWDAELVEIFIKMIKSKRFKIYNSL